MRMLRDPEVLRSTPSGLVHVVDGDVLQVAGDRVEAQAALGVHLGEADPAALAEGSGGCRLRHEWLHGDLQP